MIPRNHVPLATLMVAVWLLGACQGKPTPGEEVQVDGGSYRRVSVDELQTMSEAKDFLLVNVHVPWQGDIPQTDLRLAYDAIDQNLSRLPAEKEAKILVYCRTSGMAKTAAKALDRPGVHQRLAPGWRHNRLGRGRPSVGGGCQSIARAIDLRRAGPTPLPPHMVTGRQRAAGLRGTNGASPLRAPSGG